MNLITTENGDKIRDDDAQAFYSLVSQCTGITLNPEKDTILLSKPEWGSRSAAQYTIKCQINGNEHHVIIKRCVDNPEFIRRENAICLIKRKMNWEPFYNVIKIDGIILRKISDDSNCAILSDWQGKICLVIDIKNYKDAKGIQELSPDEIKDLELFCKQYGRWTAFNLLFAIRDRNQNNIRFFVAKQYVESIDNEEGPFDTHGNNAGVLDVVNSMKSYLPRFLQNDKKAACVAKLIEGFEDG